MPSLQAKKIVVAEDDSAIRELICVRLDLAGYYSIPACDGIQALDIITKVRPAAVILDIGMPGLDGFQVLQEAQIRLPGLPVLILTARRGSEDVAKAIGMGAHSYLIKPFDDRQLLNRIDRLTAAHQPGKTLLSSLETVWEV